MEKNLKVSGVARRVACAHQISLYICALSHLLGVYIYKGTGELYYVDKCIPAEMPANSVYLQTHYVCSYVHIDMCLAYNQVTV